MTFNEYINQTEPIRFPSVQIREEDCHSFYKLDGETKISLVIFGIPFQYTTKTITYIPDSNKTLWTTDGDGNALKISVFKLV
jgi:hypothetical protein